MAGVAAAGPGTRGVGPGTRALAARGFTLVEMLVVLGLIAGLVALALPVVARAREAGRSAACLSHLRTLAAATQAYRDEHRGLLPFADDLVDVRFSRVAPLDALAPLLDVPVPAWDAAAQRAVTGAPFACPADRTGAMRTGASSVYEPWFAFAFFERDARIVSAWADLCGPAVLFRDAAVFHAGQRMGNVALLDGSARIGRTGDRPAPCPPWMP